MRFFFSLACGEVTGQCFRAAFSMQFLTSTLVRALFPVEKLPDKCFASRGGRTLLYHCTVCRRLCFHILIYPMGLCLKLPSRAQGRQSKLKPFSYKQMGVWERLLNLGGPHKVLLSFNPVFTDYSSVMRQKQVSNKKGKTIWDRS